MITHVAIFDPNTNTRYVLPRPFRHHHIYHFSKYLGKGQHKLPLVEGFEADLNFLTRLEAYTVAVATGQLNRRVGAQYYQGPELFSEDLW